MTGVPTKAYRLPAEWIQPHSTVVNVASFKNVDEAELLKIPGVIYVPMVGKVTVAMLERNLMRLYDQFHSASPSSRRQAIADGSADSVRDAKLETVVQLAWYSAAVVTAILAIQVMKWKH